MTPQFIIGTVCECTGISIEEIKMKTRINEIAFARHLCFYFIKKYLNSTHSRIGISIRASKPYNHSTVMHGIKRIQNEIDTNRFETIDMVDVIDGRIKEYLGRSKDTLKESVSDIIELLNRIPYYPINHCNTFGELAEQLNKRISA